MADSTFINEKIDEDSTNEETETQTTQAFNNTAEVDDNCLSSQDISIIKSLLILGPSPSSRELKKLVNGIPSSSIKQTYNKILSLSKANNKEFVHYLAIILRFPHNSINLDALANMKFTAQDKYLTQLIFIYFGIAEKYYSQMNYDQKLKIFFRYIFLFSSHINLDLSIYNFFAKILEQNFLQLFISKRFYINFLFIKEFIMDFSRLAPESMIKIGYELPVYRNLVYFCTSSVITESPSPLDWIVKRWNIPINHSIPAIFYHYDCSLFLDSIAYEKFQCAENPLEIIKNNLKNCTNCTICQSQKNSGVKVQNCFQLKHEMALSIDTFNRSGMIQSPLSVNIIRLFPTVDIRSLGSFLCKEKNIQYLIKYAQSFDFKDMDILDGLRMFLSSFIMGGEGQVIDRIVTVFANEFTLQNINNIEKLSKEFQIAKINKCQEICKKISYGCIVLNTIMFNPTVEKKLTFDDFLKHLNYNDTDFIDNENPCLSFDPEDLRGIYNGIQENEMKTPNNWTDSFDKFLLFKNQLSFIKDNFGNPLENESNICDECVLVCFEQLFKNTFKSFMFLPPSTFFQISLLLNCTVEFEYYIDFHKKDITKFLASSKLYLENYAGPMTFINNVLDVIEKTEKPKASMLPDIKSMFIKSQNSEGKERSISTLSLYANVINEWINIRFVDKSVSITNCGLISRLCETRKHYIKSICHKLIINNSDMIDDFSHYGEDLQLLILNKNSHKNLANMSDNIKIKFLIQEIGKGRITDEYHDIFNAISIYNQDTFDTFCILQSKFDDFDRVVQVYKITDSDFNEKFCFNEKFAEQLSNSANLLKFVASFSSILNLKFAKTIHRDSCPLKDPKFQEFNKIVYLILKCDKKDRQLIDYVSCIINYLSDSLILLVGLYDYIFPLFSQISPELLSILIKIFAKRVKTYIENNVACCEESKDSNVVFKMRNLVNMLQDKALITENEIKAFGIQTIGGGKPDIVEL